MRSGGGFCITGLGFLGVLRRWVSGLQGSEWFSKHPILGGLILRGGFQSPLILKLKKKAGVGLVFESAQDIVDL